MRRAPIVFLGLALVLSMAGCSKNSAADVTPTPAGTATPAVTATPDGGTMPHSPEPGGTANRLQVAFHLRESPGIAIVIIHMNGISGIPLRQGRLLRIHG